jgi:hypothetical protein
MTTVYISAAARAILTAQGKPVEGLGECRAVHAPSPSTSAPGGAIRDQAAHSPALTSGDVLAVKLSAAELNAFYTDHFQNRMSPPASGSTNPGDRP